MNRTIRFRFWDLKQKKMITGVPALNLTIGHLNVNGLVPSQFTGLTDKNGKEIYEGDWIIGKDREHREGRIVFKDGAFYCFDELLNESLAEDECTVIGNIYENPELLTPKREE